MTAPIGHVHNGNPIDESWYNNLADLLNAHDALINILKGQPAAKISRTGAAQSIATSTATAVQFDTTVGTSANGSGMVNLGVNNTRITVPTSGAGLYVVIAQDGWAINTTGVRAYSLRKNGATTISQVVVPTVSGAGNAPQMSIVGFDIVSVGDYWELVASQDSGGSLSTTTSPSPSLAAVRVAT